MITQKTATRTTGLGKYISCLLCTFCCSLILTGCVGSKISDNLKPPVLESLSPRITSIDFGGVNLEFHARIRNTLPVAIQTPRFRYAIAIEDRDLAKGTHASGIDLPASGVGTATLPVRLSYADILAIAASLKNQNEAAYRLTGALLIPALGREFELPLSHDGTVPILKTPHFDDFRIESPEISGTKAKFTILAKIENPNGFALGIDQMGYSVRIGEISLGTLGASTTSRIAAGGNSTLRLEGQVSLLSAAFQILTGGRVGDVKIAPTGTIDTPWGRVAFSGGLQ